MAEQETVQQAKPEVAGPGPTISILDLQNAIKVIDYACDQGAFKGWAVIEQVAAVRTKLSAFVEAAAPKDEKAESAEKSQAKAKKAPAKAEAPVEAVAAAEAATPEAAPKAAVKAATKKPAAKKK